MGEGATPHNRSLLTIKSPCGGPASRLVPKEKMLKIVQLGCSRPRSASLSTVLSPDPGRAFSSFTMNLILLPSAERKGREKQAGMVEDSWGSSHMCSPGKGRCPLLPNLILSPKLSPDSTPSFCTMETASVLPQVPLPYPITKVESSMGPPLFPVLCLLRLLGI